MLQGINYTTVGSPLSLQSLENGMQSYRVFSVNFIIPAKENNLFKKTLETCNHGSFYPKAKNGEKSKFSQTTTSSIFYNLVHTKK